MALAVEWRWLPILRGGHLASCVGRRTERSTYTASLRCATEPLPGARQRAVAKRQRSVPSLPFFERSELILLLALAAKIGGGGRVGAQSGAQRAPLPPRVSAKSILSRSAKTGGRGVLAEPAHRGVSRWCAPEGPQAPERPGLTN